MTTIRTPRCQGCRIDMTLVSLGNDKGIFHRVWKCPRCGNRQEYIEGEAGRKEAAT